MAEKGWELDKTNSSIGTDTKSLTKYLLLIEYIFVKKIE